jgi:hypothetical protein
MAVRGPVDFEAFRRLASIFLDEIGGLLLSFPVVASGLEFLFAVFPLLFPDSLSVVTDACNACRRLIICS